LKLFRVVVDKPAGSRWQDDNSRWPPILGPGAHTGRQSSRRHHHNEKPDGGHVCSADGQANPVVWRVKFLFLDFIMISK
jgi:hypothetical protein